MTPKTEGYKIPKQSFSRIKNIVKNGIKLKGSLKKSCVYNSYSKINIDYIDRHPSLIKMVGEYKPTAIIPKEFKKIFYVIPRVKINEIKRQLLNENMLSLTPEEFSNGRISNERLHYLKKKLKLKKTFKKTKLIPFFQCLVDHEILHKADFILLKKIITERGEKDKSYKIYISIDPWDIFRMGCGYSFGSCMNCISGSYNSKLVPNFLDPSMGLIYAEYDKDRKKLTGMMARAIIRLVKTEDGLGIVMDRLYGNKSMQAQFFNVLELATQKTGIYHYVFWNYKCVSGSHDQKTASSKKILAYTLPADYKNRQYPYFDNAINLLSVGRYHTIGKLEVALFDKGAWEDE